MDLSQSGRLFTTAVIWIVWCAIHSFLNNEGPIGRTRFVSYHLGPYYRLLYNIEAVATIALVIRLIPREGETVIWLWLGPLKLVQAFLWIVALAMFYCSFKCIDIWRFLGLTVFGIGSRGVSTPTNLVTRGIYGVVRHPQILAGLILLWSRDLTDTALVTNVILSLYLLIGAKIEEKRLLARFGNDYRKYVSEVPGFVPRCHRRS